MSNLEQMQEALQRTIKLTKDERFTELYSTDEQQFFRNHIKELNEDIDAEYEALAFIRQRDRDSDHDVC